MQKSAPLNASLPCVYRNFGSRFREFWSEELSKELSNEQIFAPESGPRASSSDNSKAHPRARLFCFLSTALAVPNFIPMLEFHGGLDLVSLSLSAVDVSLNLPVNS